MRFTLIIKKYLLNELEYKLKLLIDIKINLTYSSLRYMQK